MTEKSKKPNIEAAANVVLMKLDGITPYEDNAKIHDELQINKLVEQIKLAGFDQPIVVDKDLVIIKGHGRFLAAKKMNLEKVPVVVNSDITKDQAIAVRIADNKVAETGWDHDKLRSEISYLQEMEFDLTLTSFDEKELDVILKIADKVSNDAGGEVDMDAMDDFECKCPRCGFEFNKKAQGGNNGR